MPVACRNPFPWKALVAFIFLTLSLEGGLREASPGGIGLHIETDKALYHPGEPVTISLTLFNHSGDKITFHFRSSKRYDFFINDEGGNEVWRWSSDKLFAMVLGEVTMAPGSKLTYSVRFEGLLRPGTYGVTGLLADERGSMSGEIRIGIE